MKNRLNIGSSSCHLTGWISFDQSRKVFSSSSINLSTHVRLDGNIYINERVCQILGCHGLLLVDNGSTDKSANIIQSKYGKRNICIYRNKTNLGCAKAWNQGVFDCKNKKCDYIILTQNDVLF